MGVILSLIRRLRSKPTTDKVLEGIDNDIEKLEASLQKNRHLQGRIVLLLVLFSVVIYVAGATILYRWFLPDKLSERLLCFVPFLAFPLLVVILRRILHFFFVTRINKLGKHLTALKERKKDILESVTETEKYKVAKDLLEKYDPKGEFVARAVLRQDPIATPGQELRRRNVQDQTNRQAHGTPLPVPQLRSNQGTPLPGQPGAANPNQAQGFVTPLPNIQNCPILPRERTPFDKIAEYFIGDGPSYRYALICKRCKYHNGMALQDEFEFIEYRCCYCGHFNPSRRQRAEAPPLYEDETMDSVDEEEEIEEANGLSSNDDTGEAAEESHDEVESSLQPQGQDVASIDDSGDQRETET